MRVMNKGERKAGERILTLIALFQLTGAILLSLKSPEPRVLLVMLALFCLTAAAVFVTRKFVEIDSLLLSLVVFLCALGILVLTRMDAGKGLAQALNCLLGLFSMVICFLFFRFRSGRGPLVLLASILSIVLMTSPLVLGTEKNGALAWISVAGLSFQPSEAVKIVLVLALSKLLSRRKMVATYAYAAVCLGLLFLQKDLGTALLYYMISLTLVFSATGRFTLLAGGVAGASAGAVLGYRLFGHVRKRVRIWIDPWADYSGEGYQIVQSLIAIVNGGLWGAGLGAGDAYNIPEYATDFIFPVLVNEFGAIFGICVILIYLMILLKGIGIAMRARKRFDALVALGCSSFIALQAFVIVAGNIKMIPLTGVTLPFVSYGGTSLVSSMGLIGLLLGVSAANSDSLRKDERLASLGDTAYASD